MHHTTVLKALSITLLLSCAAHTQAMQKKGKTIRETFQGNKEIVRAAGPTGSGHLASSQIQLSPELEAIAASGDAVLPDTAVVEQGPIRATAAQEAVIEQAKLDLPVQKQAIKTLLGKELALIYSIDETKLVQQGLLRWTDATVPYKDEGRLINGLEINDTTYLKLVQAKQDLNRTLNHICAGIIQKVKEQSTFNAESNTPTFTIEQIEAILDTQFSRAMVLNRILHLCNDRIKSKLEPILYGEEDAKELAQKCFTAISQLQLERKRIRSEQENERIRQIKAAQRLAYRMRLTADKGTISDEEYSDAFIFDKTTTGN